MFKTIVVRHPTGLQARVASELAHLTAQFKSEIIVWKEEIRANAKSLMGLVALGAGEGTHLKFVFEGEDAEEALEAVYRYLVHGIRVKKNPPPNPFSL